MSKDADSKIDINLIPKTPKERITEVSKALLTKSYVIDVHCHFFDMKCINRAYFIKRWVKDKLHLKSTTDLITISADEADLSRNVYTENWEDDLIKNLTTPGVTLYDTSKKDKGFFDVLKASVILKMKTMKSVYNYYLEECAISNALPSISRKDILVTGLMMDFLLGWDVTVGKNLLTQVAELKDLSEDYPVLPFLFCDPRRAELPNDENLYFLFGKAFCQAPFFFGIKIYPSLGYDPSDNRLWPIYRICEKLRIPVLTHCGGETVGADYPELVIRQGDTELKIYARNRSEMAYKLNDPSRWRLVLEKFPLLKLNFGHFGGYETWMTSNNDVAKRDYQERKNTIIDFMHMYDNVYADFSFNFVERDLTNNFINRIFTKGEEKVLSRSLFGTDYWVVNKESNLIRSQEQFISKVMDAGGEEGLYKLIRDNSYKYLFG